MKDRLLLALDLDGTLLNSALEISEENRHQLQEFQRQGHLVTIATGRPLQGARRYAHELGLTVPLIINNGALVAEANGRTHNFYPVAVQAGRELLQYCRAHDLPCSFFLDEEIYMLRPCPLAERLHQTHDLAIPKVAEDPEAIIGKGVSNYVITLEPDQVDVICEQLQAEFHTRLHVVRSGKHFLDVFQPGVSKGRALEVLAQSLGIQQSNVIAVGDNHNDLEMLEYAGLGVAMAGADRTVKMAADYVTTANDQDGVANLVKKILAGGDHLALAVKEKEA